MSILKAGRPSLSQKAKALSVLRKEDDTFRTSIHLPKSLHLALKRKAIDLDKTVTKIIIEIIKDFLGRK